MYHTLENAFATLDAVQANNLKGRIDRNNGCDYQVHVLARLLRHQDRWHRVHNRPLHDDHVPQVPPSMPLLWL